jgi:uncharacterized protein YidB (DUF937 family)
MSSLFDNVLGQVSNAIGGMSGQQQGLAGSVINMINSQPGGLSGLVQTMHEKGLGEVAKSWVGTGQNLAITPDQIQHVLGNEQVQKFANEHHIDVQQVSAQISKILPVVVDKMTPNGQLPQGGALDALKGIFGAPRS